MRYLMQRRVTHRGAFHNSPVRHEWVNVASEHAESTLQAIANAADRLLRETGMSDTAPLQNFRVIGTCSEVTQ